MRLPGNGALPTCPSQRHVVVLAASTVHGNAAHRRQRGPSLSAYANWARLVTANVEDVRHLSNLIKMVPSQRPRRRGCRRALECEGGYAGMSPASLMTYISGQSFPVRMG